METERKGNWAGRWCKRLGWILAGLALLVMLAVLFWLRGALYNRWVRFPGEQAALKELRAQRQPVTLTASNLASWKEYRGIIHSHSELSHDCEVPFPEILRVLKVTGVDFICLSDHCTDGRADFGAQWRGFYEGKLFIPGFEMKAGMMPIGVASGVVLSNSTEPGVLARQIVENGGLLFYAHVEEPRDWDRPELNGMEIYNIHSDVKRLRGGLRALLPDLLVNQRRYPEEVFRTIFHRPTPFLERWDELNRTRRITGIAGNDCHQNTGVRGFMVGNDRIRIEDTSPETLREVELNWLTRPLARALFGSLEPGKKLFHVQLDPYERMGKFVNTHVLCRELTFVEVVEALRAGRAFVGFNHLADAGGFRWFATSGDKVAVMGEDLGFSGEVRLRADSPLPCRFTVMRDGAAVHRQEGRSLDWVPPGAGRYRVEAELKVRGEWLPWVYANSIRLTPP